jgi:hypothetical protein
MFRSVRIADGHLTPQLCLPVRADMRTAECRGAMGGVRRWRTPWHVQCGAAP